MCIGLLYAMKGEIESMLTEDTPLLQEKAGVSFYRIREDIIACCGGVGKVNAAMATQLFIDLYRPDLILNVGVAGCFEDLPIGTLVLPDRFMQHDMDTSGIGDPVGLISTVNRMDFPTARLEDAKTVLDELGIAYGDGGVTLISFDAGRTALSYCKDGKIDLCAECNPLHGPRVRALIEQLARGETPEKLSYMPEALFTADTLTAELLESRVY